MKDQIREWLKKADLYDHLKFSSLFRAYEMLFKPGVIIQHKKELRLYKTLLCGANLIFDIGAYDGHKTVVFAKISKRVISCEPDPCNFKILRTRFRNSKYNHVQILNKAVYNSVGKKNFFRNKEGSAFNTLNSEWVKIIENDNTHRWKEKISYSENITIEVETTTLKELISQYGIPDFIKIDVEGSELEVLQTLDQKIRCISFECLLPEFGSQFIEILNKLVSLDNGYRFNIIFHEELMLQDFISLNEIGEWSKHTKIHSFDVVAVLNV